MCYQDSNYFKMAFSCMRLFQTFKIIIFISKVESSRITTKLKGSNSVNRFCKVLKSFRYRACGMRFESCRGHFFLRLLKSPMPCVQGFFILSSFHRTKQYTKNCTPIYCDFLKVFYNVFTSLFNSLY